jgi:N-acetylneuraminic acid mutarotase
MHVSKYSPIGNNNQVTVTGSLILNVEPTQNNQLANKGSVDSLFTNKILKAGDALTTPSTQTTAPIQDNHSIRKIDVTNRITQADSTLNNLTTTQIDALLNTKILKTGDTVQGILSYNANYTADANLVTKKTIDSFFASTSEIAGTGAPVTTGTVIEYGSSAIPSGYLRLNGASVSKATYNNLYEVIGDAFAPPVPGAGIPWQSQCGFNPSTQSDITGWTSTNSLTTVLSYPASLVTKNYIYILGGYNTTNGTLNTIQRASFDANGVLSSTWSNVGTIPVAMYAMGYVAAKGRFYLIGGHNSSGDLSSVYSAPINADGTLGTFRAEISLPAGRNFPVCFVIKNKLYVVGGNNTPTNTVYRTTINTDGTLSSWETLPNFPISFQYGRPLLIKDRIYIFGTFDVPNNVSKNYYATYDSDGNIGTWNYVGNIPSNIINSSIVCTDNYVFSIGGFNLNISEYTNVSYCAPILIDGSIGTWTQITNAPITADHVQVVMAGNKIYFIGGFNGNSFFNTVYSANFTSGITDYTPYYTDQPSTSIASSFVASDGIPWQSQCGFNPSTQSDITDWASTNSLATATINAASLVTKNYIYILGGLITNGATSTIQRASFDANGNLSSSWSNIGSMPNAMYGMGYVATKGRFYLIGGNDGFGDLSPVYSVPINSDGTLGTFRTETTLPNARRYAVCFVIKNKLYVVGGSSSNTVFQATINNDGTLSSWTTLPNFPINFNHGIPLLIKDRIYIFGAYGGSGATVYYSTYDSNGNIGPWTYVANMPNNITESVIVSTDNYVFSICGYNNNNSTRTNAAYRAPILDDSSIGAWAQISDGPVIVFEAQSAIAGNKIYFIGGNSNTSGESSSVYSATFTSGITDYTPYYTDQPSTTITSSSTFYLPNYYSKEAVNPGSYYYIKT